MLTPPRIGVRAESTGLPPRRLFAEAARAGAAGVQFDPVGPLAPEQLTETGRREFRHLLRSFNLSLAALGCPLRGDLGSPQNQEERLAYVRGVMSLATDLGTNVVVVETGMLPEEPDTPRARALAESLSALGAHGDRIGVTLALESGLNSGAATRDYLARFDTGSLGVNYDPGNMLLNGFNPVEHLVPLKDKIVHTHARDVRAGTLNRQAAEVALGAGAVDWLAYTATLGILEYRGFLTIEREPGPTALGDVLAGVKFLKQLVG